MKNEQKHLRMPDEGINTYQYFDMTKREYFACQFTAALIGTGCSLNMAAVDGVRAANELLDELERANGRSDKDFM